MKKSIITVLLSISMTVGSIGAVPRLLRSRWQKKLLLDLQRKL